MSETSERLMKERLRLVRIREELTAAVINNKDDTSLIPFYKQASNYIQYAMHRLHEQWTSQALLDTF
jgi:hypothetical protein